MVSIRGEEIPLLKKYAAELKEAVYGDPRHRRPRADARARPPRVPAASSTASAPPTSGSRPRPSPGPSARWSAARRSRPTRTRRARRSTCGSACPLAMRRDVDADRRPAPRRPAAATARRRSSRSPSSSRPSGPRRRRRSPAATSPARSLLTANLDGLPLGTAVQKIREAAAKIDDGARATGSYFPRRGRGHGGDLRLHGRGAPPRGHLRLPDPRGAVRVVHRPALDHALAAALDRRHGGDARS